LPLGLFLVFIDLFHELILLFLLKSLSLSWVEPDSDYLWAIFREARANLNVGGVVEPDVAVFILEKFSFHLQDFLLVNLL
jgi:hypothetical protein